MDLGTDSKVLLAFTDVPNGRTRRYFIACTNMNNLTFA